MGRLAVAGLHRLAAVARAGSAPPTVPAREGYALWAESYPPWPHNPLMRAEQAVVAPILESTRPTRALDVGTGSGRYLPLLVAAGARVVVGIDLSMAMLSWRNRPEAAGAHEAVMTASRVCGDACRLPFRDASCDLVNAYGLLKGRERYESASAWISDMRPRLRTDPSIQANRGYRLASRLFIGGLKNLLAGVTTVAHHNPLYREIRRSVPIRVVRRFGWPHSFLLENQPVGARGEPGREVRARYRVTPRDAPFIVHIGEGVDEAAALEVERLEALGCLGGNTVLVHGLALDLSQWRRVVRRGGSLVWCPASNQFLFGRTTPMRQLLDVTASAQAHVCLGSDSRLTGSRDLLGELSEAASLAPLTPRELLCMVTTAPARVLRLSDAGAIELGARADLVVIPARSDDAAEALVGTTRRDVSFVAVGGQPMLAAPSIGDVFRARRTHARAINVDGSQRLADPRLAHAIRSCPIREPGVDCV